MKLAQLNRFTIKIFRVFVLDPCLVYSSSVLQRSSASTLLARCIANVAAAQLIHQSWVAGVLGGWRVRLRLSLGNSRN